MRGDSTRTAPVVPPRPSPYPRRVRALAVDFGERRIGLAVSDGSGSIVVGVGAVARKSDAQAAAEVAAAAREREVSLIVVGHPVLLDGTEGERAQRTRRFADRLRKASGLPVELHGEALTTAASRSTLDEAGVPASRRAEARDAEAAATILRDWLAHRRATDGD